MENLDLREKEWMKSRPIITNHWEPDFYCSKCGKGFYSLSGLDWHVTLDCHKLHSEDQKPNKMFWIGSLLSALLIAAIFINVWILFLILISFRSWEQLTELLRTVQF